MKSLLQEIEHIDRALITLRELEKIEEKLDDLVKYDSEYNKNLLDISEKDKILKSADNLIKSKAVIDSLGKMQCKIEKEPEINVDMGKVFLDWRNLYNQSKIFSSVDLNGQENFKNPRDMSKDIDMSNDFLSYAKFYKANEVLKKMTEYTREKIDLTELNTYKNSFDGTKIFNESINELKATEKDLLDTLQSKKQCESDIKNIKEKLGGICPTCNNRLDSHEHVH